MKNSWFFQFKIHITRIIVLCTRKCRRSIANTLAIDAGRWIVGKRLFVYKIITNIKRFSSIIDVWQKEKNKVFCCTLACTDGGVNNGKLLKTVHLLLCIHMVPPPPPVEHLIRQHLDGIRTLRKRNDNKINGI